MTKQELGKDKKLTVFCSDNVFRMGRVSTYRKAIL